MPENLINLLKYSNKPFEKDEIVYIQKDYVAYASLKVQKVAVKGGVEVQITNIRRKEYYDEPLTDADRRDLEKISEGVKYMREKAENIQKCGWDIQKYSYTRKFV